MNPSLHWGILGTGRIASTFAQGVARSQTGRVVAVASRGADKAAAFAAAHSIERAHSSYEALLADPTVQAVYVATPHPQHVPWVVRAAKAGNGRATGTKRQPSSAAATRSAPMAWPASNWQ